MPLSSAKGTHAQPERKKVSQASSTVASADMVGGAGVSMRSGCTPAQKVTMKDSPLAGDRLRSEKGEARGMMRILTCCDYIRGLCGQVEIFQHRFRSFLPSSSTRTGGLSVAGIGVEARSRATKPAGGAGVQVCRPTWGSDGDGRCGCPPLLAR